MVIIPQVLAIDHTLGPGRDHTLLVISISLFSRKQVLLLFSERSRLLLGHAAADADGQQVPEAGGLEVLHDVVPTRERCQPPARKSELRFAR